jgi:hypothetical protein
MLELLAIGVQKNVRYGRIVGRQLILVFHCYNGNLRHLCKQFEKGTVPTAIFTAPESNPCGLLNYSCRGSCIGMTKKQKPKAPKHTKAHEKMYLMTVFGFV